MLLYFILIIISATFAYLFYARNLELKKLQKYSSTLENELLQKQIKLEETILQTKHSETLTLANAVDSITGLPSIPVFEDRAGQAFLASQRLQKSVGIMLLAIQDFGYLSQNLGLEKINFLLSEIAKRMNGCIRQLDTVSHFQEDIFIFLLPQLTQPEAAAYAVQRILNRLEEPFFVDNQPIKIAVRTGISIFPHDGDNLKSLYDYAYDALQKTKTINQEIYFYNAAVQEIYEHENKIKETLHRRDLFKKLCIYCLPQVDVKTNQVIGVKALPYIQDSDLGLLTFEEYHAIAERENMMTNISGWLMSEIMTKYKLWETLGVAPERVAINMTVKQIQNHEFIQEITTMLHDNGFDPHRLAFEITADEFSGNVKAVQEAFATINGLGIQLSIGVFALGHLAIQKITQLPINYLKIDNRLIQNISIYSNNEVILMALMELSSNLGLQAIVEGVDEEIQKKLLQDIGFKLMQGKLFGEPKPLATLLP